MTMVIKGAVRGGLAFALTLGLCAGVRAADFSAKGLYTEACTCHAPCGCELIGVEKGCQGVGAIRIDSGNYDGRDMSGVKIAYAVEPTSWVRIYIDSQDAEKRSAAEAFARVAFAPFGKVESVKDASVDIQGTDGKYTVKVDGGKTMEYQTEPVLGGDKKTPIAHVNTQSGLSSTFLQGKGVSCKFSDGDRSFTIEPGRNAYFNDKMDAQGTL